MKRYTIFAGVNGAGKSTLFDKSYNPLENEHRINTDEMVKAIGSWQDDNLQMQCAREAIKLIREYFANGISFNQETTLTGNTIMNNIKKAKRLGYEVHLYYVGVDTVEIALDRIARRVAAGGHGIPEEDVRRRYKNSFKNFSNILPLCDVVVIHDNTNVMDIVAKFANGNLVYRSKKVPKWITDNSEFDDLVEYYF